MPLSKQLKNINWDKINNLLPVIIQNNDTGEVLMLGYMNREALDKTINEKIVTFYSRTKNRLWTKGETSKNYLHVIEFNLDCDFDSLLILVNPEGKTCHQGTDSCFSDVSETINWIFFSKLEKLINSRKNADPSNSYTGYLYSSGTKRIAQKVGEEAIETALAATVNDNEELINEAADLVFHLTVLLQDQNVKWSDIISKLKERNNNSN